MYETLDAFWSEYTNSNNKNDTFDSNNSYWSSTDIYDGNSNLWHHNYSLTFTTVFGFVACGATSNILGIGYEESSWGDVKIIYSGKISYLGSDIYENQSILYTSVCIEDTSIVKTLSKTDSKDSSNIN